MMIGTTKEIKTAQYRVASTPNAVAELIAQGHQVLVEYDTGLGSGFSDEEYRLAGAETADKDTLLKEAK